MKTQTYKKIAFSTLLSILVVASLFLVSAQAGDYDNLKQRTLTMLDNSISRLENAKETISGNPKLDDATKENILTNLTSMQDHLTNYKAEVENTTTIVELRNLNTEILQYLIDNKDIIRNNMRMALMNVAQKTLEKAQEFEEKVKFLLEVLERTCTSEATKIERVQSQLTQMDTHIELLESAIQSKDSATIRVEVKAINTLAKSIIVDMTAIKQACLPTG